MSKAKLEFELPDDEVEFTAASNGMRWRGMVFDLDTRLRDILKYQNGLSQEKREAFEEARSLLLRGLDENNLTIID